MKLTTLIINLVIFYSYDKITDRYLAKFQKELISTLEISKSKLKGE